MNRFSLQRFRRVMQNDALRIALPLSYCTVLLLALTVLFYNVMFSDGQATSPAASTVLFGIYLLGVGLLLTGMAFQDMHHPLEGYRFLTLPSSNLERFLSRYLLTGPLFLLYAVLTFSAMDWVANLATERWGGRSEPLFSPFDEQALLLIRVYLLAHVLTLTGAICFRSQALIRTAVALLAVSAGCLAVLYVSLRIFYWNAFSWNRFSPVGSLSFPLDMQFTAAWMNVVAVVGLALWMLYVAYRCLCAHEVQRGL